MDRYVLKITAKFRDKLTFMYDLNRILSTDDSKYVIHSNLYIE